MQRAYNSSLDHLRCALSLGLLCAAVGCGTTPADTSSTATEASSTTGSTGMSGSTGSTGASSGSTGDDTTGESGTSSSSTAATGSTGETTTGETTTDTTGTTDTGTTTTGGDPVMGFFVGSMGSPTGDLGGLAGADMRCQALAEAVGAGGRTWHAYLSAEKGENDEPVHARDRIGEGPWFNAALALVANDLDELHALDGEHELFLDESGEMVNGQWEGSPDPNEHDILTGTNKDGTVVMGKTCGDWTSSDPELFAWVGHADGLGPMMSDDEIYRPWNSVHESGGCHDTAPKGGAGRVYCFAID